MKLIDEKGKIFGKINIIDFLVVLLLISLLPVLSAGYRLFLAKPTPTNELIDIEIPCNLIKIRPEISKLISIGDKEVDDNGLNIGEITWIGESRPFRYSFDIGSKEININSIPGLKQIPAKLKLKAGVKDDLLYYKDTRLNAGLPFKFRTSKYSIIAVPAFTKTEKMDIGIILKHLDSETSKSINVGDKEVGPNGETIAEILKVGKTSNNVYEIDLGNGNFATAEQPDKLQVFVQMRLRCEISDDGKMYFKGMEIKNNYPIVFATNKYTVSGVISSQLINEKWMEVRVKFSEVIPELVRVIKAGDTEKDPSNRIVGKLQSIASNEPSAIQVFQKDGMISVNQLLKRDIVAVLNLLCMEKEGIAYFKNNLVKMGNLVTFTTDLYNVSGTIIGLEGN